MADVVKVSVMPELEIKKSDLQKQLDKIKGLKLRVDPVMASQNLSRSVAAQLSKIDTTLKLDFTIDAAAIEDACSKSYVKALEINTDSIFSELANQIQAARSAAAAPIPSHSEPCSPETGKTNILGQLRSFDSDAAEIYGSAATKLDWPGHSVLDPSFPIPSALGLQYKTA